MVGTGFGGAVGGVWAVGGVFVEQRISRSERTEHLVGGDMDERPRVAAAPEGPGRFEELEGADEIGVDEVGRCVDGTVDM